MNEIITNLCPGLTRILAPNASAMTFTGTNTYLLGEKEIAVIDPGPDDRSHFERILGQIPGGARISHIFVTHSHIDHSELAPKLAAETGAFVHAYGDNSAGQSPHMAEFSNLGGGEGSHHSFTPHRIVDHQDVVQSSDWTITAHWTPGHFGNHMCFEWEDILFTGDLVMGWATSMASPPDGDLGAFVRSLDLIEELDCNEYLPGHGPKIADGKARLRWLREHRMMREAQILECLGEGPMRLFELTQRIYADVPFALHGAASRNALAHLIELAQQNRVLASPKLEETALFSRAPNK